MRRRYLRTNGDQSQASRLENGGIDPYRARCIVARHVAEPTFPIVLKRHERRGVAKCVSADASHQFIIYKLEIEK